MKDIDIFALELHPLSSVFNTPVKESKRLHSSLVLSMKERGYMKKHPVLLLQEKTDGLPRVVDGRHRINAAKEVGVTPTYQIIRTYREARDLAVTHNLIRRKFTIVMATACLMRAYPAKTRDEIRAILGDAAGNEAATFRLSTIREHGCIVKGRKYTGEEAIAAIAENKLSTQAAARSASTLKRLAQARAAGKARKPLTSYSFELPARIAEQMAFFADLNGKTIGISIQLACEAWVKEMAVNFGIDLNGDTKEKAA